MISQLAICYLAFFACFAAAWFSFTRGIEWDMSSFPLGLFAAFVYWVGAVGGMLGAIIFGAGSIIVTFAAVMHS